MSSGARRNGSSQNPFSKHGYACGTGMKILFTLPFACMFFAPLAAADDIAPMALNSIGAVPAKIASAKVVDGHGAEVGSVAKIETDAMGKPLRADIALTGGRMIFIDASQLGYDQSANMLVTAMDQKQLVQSAQTP
jgi:hypothetical protein